MTREKVIHQYNEFVVPSYFKTPLVIEKASGTRLWDDEGEEYLDFFPGWAVSGIGHCHPRVTAAIKRQAQTLAHVPNNYYHPLQAKLAQTIIHHSFDGKVFFCNSGAEANEAAIKLVRKLGNPSRNEIITMEKSFHGRTMATLSATGQKKFWDGFEPLVPGFKHVPFNDEEAIKNAVTSKTIAIMLEPIQGEGGVVCAKPEYLQWLRRFTKENDIYLIFDEVQTSMGRTGKMFCYKNYAVEPDVMTLAKSLGNGFPIGAMIAQKKIADTLSAGTHASTFGGNPLACAAALATFEAIEKEKLISNAVVRGEYLAKKLQQLKQKHGTLIRSVRGMALMAGLELSVDGKAIYEHCLARKLLINCTQGNILRIMPALVVKNKEIDRAMDILDEALEVEGLKSQSKKGSLVS